MYLDITFKSVNFNFPTMAHFTSFLCTFDFWIWQTHFMKFRAVYVFSMYFLSNGINSSNIVKNNKNIQTNNNNKTGNYMYL